MHNVITFLSLIACFIDIAVQFNTIRFVLFLDNLEVCTAVVFSKRAHHISSYWSDVSPPSLFLFFVLAPKSSVLPDVNNSFVCKHS